MEGCGGPSVVLRPGQALGYQGAAPTRVVICRSNKGLFVDLVARVVRRDRARAAWRTTDAAMLPGMCRISST